MDADRDGIPCQIVYPASKVRAYWHVGETVVNEAVAAALVDAHRFGEGLTFCGHRLRGYEEDPPRVTAYVDGSCEAYRDEDGLLALARGQGIWARVDLVLRGGQLVAVGVAFESGAEDDPSTVFPPHMTPTAVNEAMYPDHPLLQAAEHFGAVKQLTLGSTATCEEIADFGYPDYSHAVAYWLRQGRPNSLDADRDGRPCEEAFDRDDVDRYWNEPLVAFPQNMTCRTLADRGIGFEAAVAYWLEVGAPDRMDADGNGVPCETVYAADDVDVFLRPGRSHATGLFCRDLEAAGVPYPEAVAYWLLEGAADRMDANRNGIPCETVYNWSLTERFLAASREALTPHDPGLYCRDLHAGAWSYGQAVRYWLQHGSPARMDADRDGIPCETVYPAHRIAKWLEFDRIFWIPDDVDYGWSRSATAWPDIRPGCCGGPDVAPLSPTDPWPANGWPVDGFYPVGPSEAAWDVLDSGRPVPAAVATYELAIGRWIPTESGFGVTIDHAAPTLHRNLRLTEDLTVVIQPGEWADASPDALVGNGSGFRLLLANLHDYWLGGPGASIDGYYIGPEGALISIGIRWYFFLEIRGGEPILYLLAAYIAG
jgi:hypothetical protein